MATGSYEGSLLMEGTSDHHEPSTFTSRRSRWSWRLPHTSKARAVPKRTHVSRRDGEGRAQAGERGRGDRGVRGTVVRGLRGKKTPTLPPSLGQNTNPGGESLRRQHSEGKRVLSIHRKRFERRENARASGQAASSPDSVGRPRGETRGSERRKHTRWRVHASSVRVAEVDRTHRASCPPGGCKASWRSRQGASQKEARSTT